MATLTNNGTLQCDMRSECRAEVTHIGSKGYVYCAEHAITRRQSGYERTRRMLKREIEQLKRNEPLKEY